MKKIARARLRQLLTAKEVVMTLLALSCLALLILEHLEKLSPEQLKLVEVFEIGVGVLFLIEFVFELYYARDRGKYWRHHWFFLLASIPLPFQSVDWLRSIRALRILRLLKVFAHLDYEHNTRLVQK